MVLLLGMYSQSHLGWHFRMLFQRRIKAQSSKLEVSFHWNVAKETFELWALSFQNLSPQVGLAVCHPKKITVPLALTRDVTSHKESWEGNGKSHSHNSNTVMGMGREPGIFLWKNICWRQPANKKLKIASESEKVFARILDEFLKCSGLPKTSVFKMDNSNYYDLDPSPCILILRIILFSHKKVFLMVIVNIQVNKRNTWNVTMRPVCKYL